MKIEERQYLTVLYSFTDFGPARTKLIIDYFGSAKNAWNANKKDLIEIGMSKKTTEKFINYRGKKDLPKYFNELKKLDIDYTTYFDDNFPENLKDLDDAPLVLYYKGSLKRTDVNSVAIVGSRKITAYGREVTKMLSLRLSGIGVSIVSGLAFGVDLVAHESALDAGGRCIAVLASGLDRITPRSNEWLGKSILKKNGALISEYPPGTEVFKALFPYRNRIISGLSKAVIVVEGTIKSGTIHTANHAAAQGRQVFAVPGQITSPMSAAPHYLIKNGAKMVTEVNDILEELDLQLKVNKEEIEKVMPQDETETKLVQILENEPLHLDIIAKISKLKVEEISSKLTIMELKGMVKGLGGGIYKKI